MKQTRVNNKTYVAAQRRKKLCVSGPHVNDRWPKQRCSQCAEDQKQNYLVKRAAHKL